MVSCLFCGVPCPPTFVVVDGKVTRVKTEVKTSDNLPCSPGGEIESLNFEEDPPIIGEHLKVIFILRRVLEVREEKLCQLLGEANSLETWVNLCSSCEGAVNQCYKIIKEIIKLERRLKTIKTELKEKIVGSKDVDDSSGMWNIIRDEILLNVSETSSEKESEEVTLASDHEDCSSSTSSLEIVDAHFKSPQSYQEETEKETTQLGRVTRKKAQRNERGALELEERTHGEGEEIQREATERAQRVELTREQRQRARKKQLRKGKAKYNRVIDGRKCCRCLEEFPTYYQKLMHLREVHNVGKSWVCQGCLKNFQDRAHFTRHLRDGMCGAVWKRLALTCPFCSKVFPRKRNVDNHVPICKRRKKDSTALKKAGSESSDDDSRPETSSEKESEEVTLACDYDHEHCSSSTSSLEIDDAHLKSQGHQKNGETEKETTQLGRVTRKKARRNKREAVELEERTQRKVEQLQRVRRVALARDQRQRARQEQLRKDKAKWKRGKDRKCHRCLEEFPNYYQKLKHLREVHNVGKSWAYHCQGCLKTFQDRAHYIRHLRDGMCGAVWKRLALTCPFCTKVFPRKRNVDNHVPICRERKDSTTPKKAGSLPDDCRPEELDVLETKVFHLGSDNDDD